MKKHIILGAFIFANCGLYAQQIKPAPSEKIYHEIAKLKHLTNVLYFAAHPDDENTRLLAWLVNEKNINTAYMSLTRGDGGQNILGSEQGDALGLIRTHELIEARKLDGAGQFFSRAVDFGFSKSYSETFTHWNQYILDYDAVWVIRKFRPDVIICRFPPNTLAGHGQHAASAIIAADAFKKAGDKLQYTEQLQFCNPWKPKRILWNTYKFGDKNTTAENQFKLKVGQYQPGIGMGAGELAGISRSIHRSQGAGTPSVPGVQTEYFSLVDGDSLSTSLFDGIDISWNRVNRQDIGDDIKIALKAFDFRHPDASIPALLEIRKKILTVKDDFWRTQKLGEIDQIIIECAGILAEVTTKQPQTVAGTTLPFNLKVIARSGTPVQLVKVTGAGFDSTLNLALSTDSLISIDHLLNIPANTPITEPYWLSMPRSTGDLFSMPNDTLIGYPEAPNHLTVTMQFSIGGVAFPIQVPLSFKKLDPLKGDLIEQLRIVPHANVSFNAGLLITKPDGSVDAELTVHAYTKITNGSLNVWSKTDVLKVNSLNLNLGADTSITVHLNKEMSDKQGTGDFYLNAEVTNGDQKCSKTMHLIQYSHLPTLQYFTPAFAKVLRANWKCSVSKIGFVEGAGDYMPTLLRNAGLKVDMLTDADFSNADNLKKYDVIITGIRAINVDKKMSFKMPSLLKYAENGGTLLMQYNTLQDMATTNLGPYPFSLSDKRVTEENASIELLDSKHKIFNTPNKITESDFNDWVQERGLYFASKWDEKYTPLFSMNDKNEEALKGCTLYTKYGKGHYIYTSLSFFRQSPAGNKGAIRLLMNMLSVGKDAPTKKK